MITRRDTARLLLASAAAAALPLRLSAATAEEWAAALDKALTAAVVPGSGTLLSRGHFEFGKTGRQAGMIAVIRMDWPPGYRTRKFIAKETGEQETFRRLVEKVLAEFQWVNPGGLREVRFR